MYLFNSVYIMHKWILFDFNNKMRQMLYYSRKMHQMFSSQYLCFLCPWILSSFGNNLHGLSCEHRYYFLKMFLMQFCYCLHRMLIGLFPLISYILYLWNVEI